MNFRTFNELAAPDVSYHSVCIDYPKVVASFVFNSGLIHLLPRFYGFVEEDPCKHLKEFHMVCSTMKAQGIEEEHIKLRAFPFSLADYAKDWLYNLPPGCVTCWMDMKRLFLEKFLPPFKATTISNAVEIFPSIPQARYDPYADFYNQAAQQPYQQDNYQ